MKFQSLLCTVPPIVPVGVGVDVGMVGEGQSRVGLDESRCGLCWEQRRHVKGVAGVPSLQRRQVKGAAEVSVLVVEQSRQMKGCCRVPITHCLHFRALNNSSGNFTVPGEGLCYVVSMLKAPTRTFSLKEYIKLDTIL